MPKAGRPSLPPDEDSDGYSQFLVVYLPHHHHHHRGHGGCGSRVRHVNQHVFSSAFHDVQRATSSVRKEEDGGEAKQQKKDPLVGWPWRASFASHPKRERPQEVGRRPSPTALAAASWWWSWQEVVWAYRHNEETPVETTEDWLALSLERQEEHLPSSSTTSWSSSHTPLEEKEEKKRFLSCGRSLAAEGSLAMQRWNEWVVTHTFQGTALFAPSSSFFLTRWRVLRDDGDRFVRCCGWWWYLWIELSNSADYLASTKVWQGGGVPKKTISTKTTKTLVVDTAVPERRGRCQWKKGCQAVLPSPRHWDVAF